MNTATNPATLQYIGEHLLPGQFGYFFTLLSLVASLVASYAFANAKLATKEATKESKVKK